MGVWRKKQDDYAEIERMLQDDPGQSAREIADKLGVAPTTITRALPGMEESGVLLYEDEKGRLWPFKRK
ncbi:MAG: winged helix-turn-helix domain-containing protein [Caldilineaceae bacterium]|nr:winged helix-turn-helix domain-containing protein [Caldilineaceae bacterium]